MIDVSYVCEVTFEFVVMGKCKLLNFLKVISFFFYSGPFGNHCVFR